MARTHSFAVTGPVKAASPSLLTRHLIASPASAARRRPLMWVKMTGPADRSTWLGELPMGTVCRGRQLAASAGYCPCGRRAGSLIAAEYGSLQLRSEHSIRASAVGCRLSANARSFFYVPDVARLPDASDLLRRTRYLYRRRRDPQPWYAAQERQDADWPRFYRRPACLVQSGRRRPGRLHPLRIQIVRGDARKLDAALRQLGREHGVEACFACDGDWLFFVDNRSPRWTRRPA